ncbi:MAG TPA: serine/threonine protein kinase [Gammaproteobacteria bacterium]
MTAANAHGAGTGPARILKRDGLGAVYLWHEHDAGVVVRDTRAAHWSVRWLARRLARREARALRAAPRAAGIPQLISFDGRVLRRTYLPGQPMHAARPASPAYYRDALRLLRRLHAAGITHNDAAKEANWLCTAAGRPALVDFQLAHVSARRTACFRALAREDLRHLLKHKRSYARDALTARQRALLASPSLGARAWRALVKPPYRFVTRFLLRLPERTGPAERTL